MRKKLFTLLLALVASAGSLFAESGTCGDNLTWDLTDGVLTISGTGLMTNYYYFSSDRAPWYSSPSSITSVIISDGVTSIGDFAFEGCKSLTSVTIPNSVTSVGYKAFYNCSSLPVINNLRYADKYLVEVVDITLSTYNIKTGTRWIGDDAFWGCKSLTSVTIPNSVTSIGSNAFYNCSSLTSITIPNSVTSIGHCAFDECSSLISVTIPNSVTSIGEAAFDECSSLPVINNLRYADTYLVEAVDNTLSIYTIKEGTRWIGSSAFDGCSNLTSIDIPNSVTSIGEYAFRGCSGLTSVTIPNSVTSIGENAFVNCIALTSVTIPIGVTNILYATFGGCTRLTSVTIPNSVTSIGNAAFWGCSSLTSITIPNSVTSIGEYAFWGCSSMKSVTMESAIPPSVDGSFNSTTTPIYVPLGSLKTYQDDENWKIYNLRLFDTTIKTSAVSPTSVAITFSASLNGEDKNKYIAACGIEEGEEFSGNTAEYIGLEPESEYADVPFYIRTTKEDILTVTATFKTSALELTTLASKAVSSTTAILLAETNMSDAEVSCGFEYKRNDAPADMEGNKVYCPVASGQMAGRLKNLKDDVYYKYRAFYQSAAGNMFYGDWQYIFTGDVAVEFDPILYTYGATVVRENEATISGYALAGSEDFTEQGFEYWAESRTNGGANAPHRVPAALNEHFFVQASGIALRATLTNLDAGTVYKYRVYGKVGDQYYYGAEQAFTTTGTYTPPTYTVTFANWDGAVLQSSQVEDGKMPVYSGETPVRPEDEQYTYTFSGWTPQIVAATADATYTAQYVAKDKHEGLEDIQEDNIPCTKVVRNGQIFILRGEKEYTLTGQEIK